MKKILGFILVVFMMITLSSCGKEKLIYSFSGENDNFSISNGEIILNEKTEVFSGGQLTPINEFTNIVSYTIRFYVDVNGEKETILLEKGENVTGELLSLSSELGQITSSQVVNRKIVTDLKMLEDNLYFELTTKDTEGNDEVYRVKLNVLKK